MSEHLSDPSTASPASAAPADPNDLTCPVCGEGAVQEKCKVVCRSQKCRGRIIYNCSEF